MDSESVCVVCGLVIPGAMPPYICPQCGGKGTFYTRPKTIGGSVKIDESTRATIAFVTGGAVGLYAWSTTKSGEAAIAAAVLAGAVAYNKMVSKLIGWAAVIGLCWLLYQMRTMF